MDNQPIITTRISKARDIINMTTMHDIGELIKMSELLTNELRKDLGEAEIWIAKSMNIKNRSKSIKNQRANLLSFILRTHRFALLKLIYMKDDLIEFDVDHSIQLGMIHQTIDDIENFAMTCGEYRDILIKYILNPTISFKFKINSNHPLRNEYYAMKKFIQKLPNNGDNMMRILTQDIYCIDLDINYPRDTLYSSSSLKHFTRSEAENMLTSEFIEPIIFTYLFNCSKCSYVWRKLATQLLTGPFGIDLIECAVDKYYNGGKFIYNTYELPNLPDSSIRNKPEIPIQSPIPDFEITMINQENLSIPSSSSNLHQ
jgi:hypothetical protein